MAKQPIQPSCMACRSRESASGLWILQLHVRAESGHLFTEGSTTEQMLSSRRLGDGNGGCFLTTFSIFFEV